MFMHDGILESITCGNTQVSAPDLQRMVAKLKQRDPHTNLTGYEQQFKVGTGDETVVTSNFCVHVYKYVFIHWVGTRASQPKGRGASIKQCFEKSRQESS